MTVPNLSPESHGRGGLCSQKSLTLGTNFQIFSIFPGGKDSTDDSNISFRNTHFSFTSSNQVMIPAGIQWPSGTKCLPPGWVLPPIQDDCCWREKNRIKSLSLATRMNSLAQQEGKDWDHAAPGSLSSSDSLEEGENRAGHCAQSQPEALPE